MNSSGLYSELLFGVSVTIIAYICALLIRRKFRWLHPLVTAPILIYTLLLTGEIDYSYYEAGGELVTFFLGPATVALAVPLYKHAIRLKDHLPHLIAGALVGSAAGLVLNALSILLLNGSKEMLLSALPKSVTTAVAVDLTRWLGGTPELTAALTALTGLFGSLIGPPLLRLAGVRGAIAAALAIGAASHGIGSARLLADSEEMGGVSSFSMAACAVFTPLLLLPLHLLIL
ncbi:LrgB family protein [Paenibacillus oenotherae]|uniref:LrgB family protein n=1 Tax=Paenibacillus oenotherae TaxID=1435645 RepID=A0ABS7D0R1_9BACL|nr:LrgB family protein [Paenibacillus oenotherae]MBW7473351.1 LrgB family protein [Paenibacillus oenotherae]